MSHIISHVKQRCTVLVLMKPRRQDFVPHHLLGGSIRSRIRCFKTSVMDPKENGNDRVLHSGIYRRPPTGTSPAKMLVEFPRKSQTMQQIILPRTWLGYLGSKYARHCWRRIWVMDMTENPSSANWARNQDPLLYISSDPAVNKTSITPEAIIFDQDNSSGQILWWIGNPIPWTQRSPWLRWPIYVLGGLYGGIFLVWILNRKEVPITGRSQFHLSWFEVEQGEKTGVAKETRTVIIPDHHPIVIRIRSILIRILLASGLDPWKWTLVVLNASGSWCLSLLLLPFY